jgi:hypothetical membrane protein
MTSDPTRWFVSWVCRTVPTYVNRTLRGAAIHRHRRLQSRQTHRRIGHGSIQNRCTPSFENGHRPKWKATTVSDLSPTRQDSQQASLHETEAETDISYGGVYRFVRSAGRLHDAHPSLGPAIFVSAAIYFVVQIIVAWVFIPSYSLVTNSISDLGETSCGGYGSPGMCSPRWWLMDYAGFFLLGLIMVIGSALLYHEFTERVPRERRTAMFGFSLMALAGLGSILVGFFPENENRNMHIIGAFLAIAIGNIAILVLGAGLTLPESMRRSMLIFSSLALAALLCFASHKSFGIGRGMMERIAAYPVTIWLIAFGLYISRFHPKKSNNYT